MKTSRRVIAAALAASLSAALLCSAASAQPPAPSAPPASPVPPPPTPRAQVAQTPQPDWKRMAFDSPGPMKTVSHAGGDACTIFRPETLGAGGMRHPIVLWGNGTGQMPVAYAQTLHALASYGFVVAAANTTNAGAGTEMLACLDWLTAESGKADSVYTGKLDLSKVGASGHSQGGGGTLMAGRDPRITATAPVMPYTIGLRYVTGAQALQHGPVLLLSGGADTIAKPAENQQPVFDAANTPIVWATLEGASHLVPMRGGAVYPGIIAAWFRYQLMGDAKAAAMFTGPQCGYCTNSDWTIRRKGGA